MKIKAVLLVAAAVGLALPEAAMAQQFVGTNGAVLDGMGAGGDVQNHYVYDGPPNADVTSLITQGIKGRSSRTNSVQCRIFLGQDDCLQTGHVRHIPTLSNDY
jgi:hypothetical protein